MSTVGVVDAPRRIGWSTPWSVTLLGTGILLVLVVLAAFASPGRAEWFVGFGAKGEYTPYAEEVFGREPFVSLADGHDGQAFWLQARDPLLLHADAEARVFNRPVYRAQRMLYPTLASPFRLGGEGALLWGLVLVNLGVVAAGTYVTARLAVVRGAPALLGLAFALNPLVLVAVTADLGDALAMAALLATVLALREQRFRLAVVCAVAAVLTKEVTLLSMVAIACVGVEGGPWRRRVPLVVLPAACAGVWGLYVRWRFDFASNPVAEVTGVPMRGFLDAYRIQWAAMHDWHDAAVAGALLAVAVVIVVRWCRHRTLELTAALPLALLVPFLSLGVISLWMNSVRVLGPAMVLLLVDWYATVDRDRAPAAPERVPRWRRASGGRRSQGRPTPADGHL